MKEAIYNCLKNHPNGLRLRAIGDEMHCWHINCLHPLMELKKEGRVQEKTIGRLCTEKYIVYFVKS